MRVDLSAAEVGDLLRTLAGVYDGAEQVDELAHALQTAGHAMAAGADDELLVAALLHDIGHTAALGGDRPGVPHERVGAEFCAYVATPRVSALVGAHVAAKRYRVAVDPAYAALLSPESVTSLAAQGGALSADQAAAWGASDWAADAVRLREWDDAAKVPGGATPAVDDLLPVLQRVIR